MYTEFFGLKEKPFALVPDPRYLYLGNSHREALAHLLYGIEEGEGFIQVIGQVGTGKTTLCRALMERIGSEVEVGYIFNPSSSEVELLASINREFGLPSTLRSRVELIDELNRFLLEKKSLGRRVVLMIDEAQNLEADVLEQIRLLSNLETEREKLLQIALLGQPELEEMLARPELRQLRQRITVRWTLEPFDRRETAAYVRHRVSVAADGGAEPFTGGALRALYRVSHGLPRVINAVADRALLGAFSIGRRSVTADLVRAAADELPAADRPRWHSVGLRVPAAVALLVGGIGVGLGMVAWRDLGSATAPGPQESGMALDLGDPSAPPALDLAAVESALEPQPVAPEASALARGDGGAPTSASEAPSQPETIEAALLARESAVTSALALDTLLETWGYPALAWESLSPNEFASAIRTVSPLRVFVRNATRQQLAGLNLPVILEFAPAPDELRYATLVGLDPEGDARVVLGDHEYELTGGDLDRLWTGRSFFFWSNFESVPALSPGMNGTAVRWLQARLTDLAFLQRGDASGEFDARTAEAIRRFQTSFGLEATGDVGPETLIALYQALRYGAPRLSPGATAEVS